jgi:membrane protein DedA with SNARE-associated domain
MKTTIFVLTAFMGAAIVFAAIGVIIGSAFGSLDVKDIEQVQIAFWAFIILFVIYLALGGKTKDFKFWNNEKGD